MGLFNSFFGDKREDQVKLIRGYLITEIERMYKVKPTDKEFDEIIISAFEAVKPFLFTFEEEAKDLAHTLMELSSENSEELIGLAIPLCWIRYASLSADVKSGRISEEDAKKYHNLNHLLNVIHTQIKGLLKS